MPLFVETELDGFSFPLLLDHNNSESAYNYDIVDESIRELTNGFEIRVSPVRNDDMDDGIEVFLTEHHVK